MGVNGYRSSVDETPVHDRYWTFANLLVLGDGSATLKAGLDGEKATLGKLTFILPGDWVENTGKSLVKFRVGGVGLDVHPDTIFRFGVDASGVTIDVDGGQLYVKRHDWLVGMKLNADGISVRPTGTEFLVDVRPGDSTDFTAIDGSIEFLEVGDAASADLAKLSVQALERVTVESGGKTATAESITARDVRGLVQWTMDFPIVVPVAAFGFTELSPAMAEAIDAYAAGNLSGALARWPMGQSDRAGRLFEASLYLASGRVDSALERLGADRTNGSMDAIELALLRFVRVLNYESEDLVEMPRDAVSWLVESYHQQSLATKDRGSLPEWMLEFYEGEREPLLRALLAASKGAEMAPSFGGGWARVGELQFALGQIETAAETVNKALKLAPMNVTARVIASLIRVSQGQIDGARDELLDAINDDAFSGEAHLALGLSFFGPDSEPEVGLAWINEAVMRQSGRSLFRSTLAKAHQVLGDPDAALEQLRVAKVLDEDDPTPWLYSALVHREVNQVNEAVRDLEESIRLNDNRRIYRSRQLLDRDLAVRGANLANIYHDAGMTAVSRREAARALVADYSNPSAHLFLADSFNALRDPDRLDLRYESVWLSEELLGNLLSEVGASSLSRQISQQEYSSLFREYGFSLQTSSRFRSDGQKQQNFSQIWADRRTAYSIDGEYFQRNLEYIDRDLTRFELYATVKHQVTEKDSLLFLSKVQDFRSGDFRRSVRGENLNASATIEDDQYPSLLLAGYHRAHDLNHDSLFLVGRLASRPRTAFTGVPNLVRSAGIDEPVTHFVREGLAPKPAMVDLARTTEIYSAEMNHIWRGAEQTFVGGARIQSGDVSVTDDFVALDATGEPIERYYVSQGELDERVERMTVYAYHTLTAADDIWLTLGLEGSSLIVPRNSQNAPFFGGEESMSHLGPKVSFVWQPTESATIRSMYAESLGGLTFDGSVRLEPAQLAGFPQVFRSLAPESLVGSVAAPSMKVVGLALDLKLREGWYVGASLSQLSSESERGDGAFLQSSRRLGGFGVAELAERVDYDEESLEVVVNRLLGDCCSLGVSYSVVRSELDRDWSARPFGNEPFQDRNHESLLHRWSQSFVYNGPHGLFFGESLDWYVQKAQSSTEQDGPTSDVSVPLLNIHFGYRFPKQRAKLTFGLLNLVDNHKSLGPMASVYRYPLGRAFECQLELRF